MPKPPSLVSTAASWPASGAAVRLMVGWLLLCIGLQAAWVPAQRSGRQAHFHIAGDSSRTGPHGAASDAFAALSDLPAAAPHRHAEVGRHDHDERSHDVVYVGEDASEADSTPLHALKRVAGDLDGVLPSWPSCTPSPPDRAALAMHLRKWCSQTVAPPDRPPRRTA